MRTRRFLVLAALAALVSVPRADAQTQEIQDAVDAQLAEAKPAPKSDDKAEAKPRLNPVIDYLDFVFVASDRPVLLRLHLRNHGRPYSAAWDDYMKAFFTYFDKNGDGVLDKKEAERAPNMQFLQFHLQGALGLPYDGQTVPMQQMDTNKDGKVSLAEFSGFYQRSGFAPLQFANSSNKASTDGVTNNLYKRLDTNKDNKLSAQELLRAPALLRRLDLDEDEMLTASELTPGSGGNEGYAVAQPAAMNAGGPSVDLGFLEVKAGAVDGVARQVLAHYDKNKNGKLSREEIGLDKALFERLDANHDGQLDAREFAGFFRREADLELMTRAGNIDPGKGLLASIVRGISKELGKMQPIRAEIFNPDRRAMPLASRVQRHGGGGLAMSLGDAHIELSVGDQTFGQFRNLKQFYTQQFKQADTDKKGVIDRQKAKTAQFLDQIFTLADRDSDGKLTDKELTAYLDMQVQGSGCQMQLSITDQGRSLFDVLDENTDGRLSIRELRSGWTRMKPLAKSEQGLTHGDIPRRLSVSIGQGGFQRFRTVAVTSSGGMAPTRAAAKSAPLWFSKMDRNHDGDLSPREFLGSAEDFRKLDADGDGLISAEEARQFEARLPKEKAAKR
jgi:Ca2+-binding EF-hand superfamily protein